MCTGKRLLRCRGACSYRMISRLLTFPLSPPSSLFLPLLPRAQLDAKKLNGVVVDEYMCTGVEDIYAAGDIAVFPYAHSTDPVTDVVRIEHWDVAIDQGRAAAKNMMGQRKAYRCVPYFWTSQLGRSVRSAGYCFRADATIVHGDLNTTDPTKATGTVFYVQGSKVASVVTVGLADNTAVAAMELIRLDAMPSPDELRKLTSISLPDLLTTVTTTVQKGAGGKGAKAAAVEAEAASNAGAASGPASAGGARRRNSGARKGGK
jgi:hypothetical protein